MHQNTPTTIEKNNLPDDVKYAFNEGVSIYQAIQNYELGILGRGSFIKEIRSIKSQFAIHHEQQLNPNASI